MKKLKKVLLIALCVALLVTASIMGTMAYLTSSDAVTNTFTMGNVSITLDEADVDEYGVVETDDDGNTLPRTESNEYKLIPGREYTKDPVIHVAQGSEECWLFVVIQNGLGANAAIDGPNADEWTELVSGTWAYNTKVDARQTAQDVTVFTGFTYSQDVEDTAADAEKEIVVTAYAVQADGFATAQAAWAATFGA